MAVSYRLHQTENKKKIFLSLIFQTLSDRFYKLINYFCFLRAKQPILTPTLSVCHINKNCLACHTVYGSALSSAVPLQSMVN